MHVLPHNFPTFVVVMTKSDSESLEIHKIMHCFPTQTVIILFFFIIKYTFIAKTSDKDIRLWLYSFVILMAENWLIHRWIRSLNAQYISNPLGSLLGYMKLQWKKKLITFFF